ncbi:MAG: polyprenyl synthetase family protein [Deltaproteobacteria bacterium]|nr:polyprenyl synthetase family protein [Deltaproteobacteria bacterium]
MDPHRTILDRHKKHFDQIDAALDETLVSRVPLIEDMGAHSLLGRGKRLRPLLFVLSCHLFGSQRKDIYRLATVFEYIHAASLLHDDVLDNADTRRKKPTANNLWGNHAAVLQGDFLYLKSSSLAIEGKSLPFLRRLTDATTRMTEGQILELIRTHDWNISKEEYFEIITAKTAVLLSAACACGAVIAGVEKRAVASLGEFGLNLGIAFQLVDDLLDYSSSEQIMGKPVGKDLREGKITLPLIYTLPQMNRSERKRVEALFKSRRAGDADYRDLVECVRGNGVLDRIRSEAQSYVDRAKESLKAFPHSPGKRSLLEIGQYVIERKY